ncbi:MAG: hypothetical protein AAF656_00690 [Planctomycetota bacterium]
MYWSISGVTAVAAVICYGLAFTVLKRPRKGFAKAMGAIFATMAVLMAFLAVVNAG